MSKAKYIAEYVKARERGHFDDPVCESCGVDVGTHLRGWVPDYVWLCVRCFFHKPTKSKI